MLMRQAREHGQRAARFKWSVPLQKDSARNMHGKARSHSQHVAVAMAHEFAMLCNIIAWAREKADSTRPMSNAKRARLHTRERKAAVQRLPASDRQPCRYQRASHRAKRPALHLLLNDQLADEDTN